MSKQRGSTFFLILDCLMLLLISLNLSWLFFDAIFESQSIKDIVRWLSPQFYDFYIPIHQDFLRYDLIFVSIYLVELAFRWIVAIYQRDFSKWYYFPIVHWYDVLGCIPVGGFHFLRILRIVVILKRLQELNLIQWQDTFIIKTYQKYMAILTEEVSDRVVTQVLNGMSAELRQGSPVLHQISTQALAPRTQDLSEWISTSLSQVIHHTYDSRKHQIQSEMRKIVTEAASRNQDLKKLKYMPVVGDIAGELLERTITGMVFEVSDQIIDYLRSDLSTDVINEAIATLLNSLSDPKSDANHLVQDILLDIIEVIKQQVQIQQWKTNYV